MDKPTIEAVPFEAVLPLPLFSYVKIGRMLLPDGELLEAGLGLDTGMVGKLKALSLDESDQELQGHTSDRMRFGVGSYEDWYAKKRYPFPLLNEECSLAALVWIGPARLPFGTMQENAKTPDAWDTIAFRSYPPYRGKGLMAPFGRFVLETYARLCPGRGLWLSTETKNEAGIRLYEKLGFDPSGYGEDGTRRIMTLEPS